MKRGSLLIAIPFLGISAYGQTIDSAKVQSVLDKLELDVYGEIFYNAYQWETFPKKNNDIDLSRLVLYPEYHFNDQIGVEMEIEFEHGGTGATMEYDYIEEYGEFEMEIEKGGEVSIEELELNYTPTPWMEIIAGRIGLPIGLIAGDDKPLNYFTTTYNNVEATLIPTAWYEFGAGAEFNFRNWEAKLVVVNALNSSLFSSANWIKPGNAMRFETTAADAFAVCLGINYNLNENSHIGVSTYRGNSTPNRPKEDISVDGNVSIADAHAKLQFGRWKINGLLIYGHLQNADLISEANRNLSNNLNAKRTPVASETMGYLGEIAFNILPKTNEHYRALDIFAGYYYYDSMYGTTGDIFNNPRWEKTEWRGGFCFTWNDNIAIKSDVTYRTLNIPDVNTEITYTTALAFQF
ncbi:MAG TPA: hypothetical protein PK511_11055 [Chitinophagales bacterium]|nr:hypothetical protein [Chitinophagales bacterium]HMZ89104.1 hypothetical protein [Chitinophagales bacterium]HNA57887.1 hypothetical protein [Chitinophagales bacterium]HNE46455.1 hypothetical protein [Chitinophagales bacterium]HNF68683.1 hypothetical protein [Chitinophagales bacterium]